MPFETPLRKALQSHATAYGFWLTLPSASVARTILHATAASPTGGFSWVLVDGEHGLISDSHYYDLNNAVSSVGASPIVRIPWGEEWQIKRALDSGAHGILSPMCHTPEDAAKIVRYSKYPPTGSRGYGPLYSGHAFPGVAPAAYDAEADQSLVVAVQIESQSGVDNVEAIAKVEGLDVLLIGPFDLAKQLGVAHGGKEHEAAIQRTLNAAKAAGKTAAIFCTSGLQAQQRVQQGFGMVSIITDIGVLGSAMNKELVVASGASEGVETVGRTGY